MGKGWANEQHKKEHEDENYTFSQCININKGLGDYVRKKLSSINVTKDFIYPNPYKIAQQAFEKTILLMNKKPAANK